MKRDWDLLREQLLAIEEDRDFKTVVLAAVPEELTWQDGQSEADFLKLKVEQKNIEERIFGHLEMLVNNGYLEGVKIVRMNSDFGYSLSHPRLTMAGHDLLDTMRSEPVWEKIKSTAKAKGIELTFDAIKSLAALALKSLVGG